MHTDESLFNTDFTIGITNLRELAKAKGWRFEEDADEERVIRPDGTVAIRVRKRRHSPEQHG